MDELTRCWFQEIERINLTQPEALEPWEWALVELTLVLEPTMEKIHSGASRNRYDHFLIDVLCLVVLGSDEDRKLALQKLREAASDSIILH